MGFFKYRKNAAGKGFDLFGAYSWFIMGGKEFFWVLIMFMLGAILGNLITWGLGLYSADFAAQYGMLLSYPVMFIPVMLYAAGKSRRNALFEDGVALDSNNFGRFKGWCIALIAVVSTLAASFVSDLCGQVLPPMPQWLESALSSLLDGPLWVTVICSCIFAPFFEEWLCRGTVLRGLLQKMKPGWAIVLSALFFAFIHLNPWQAIPAFILGCLFGYVYYRTGSLKLTMLMHCTNNALATLASRLPGVDAADSFRDIMSPWAYWTEFVACIFILIAAVAALSSIPLKEGERSGCDRVKLEA